VLNILENFNRIVSPPIETRMTCRKELSVKPGEGGILPGSTSWGAVLQVPTHCFVESSEPGWPDTCPEDSNMHDASTMKNEGWNVLKNGFLSMVFEL